jgi:hypothetical protein
MAKRAFMHQVMQALIDEQYQILQIQSPCGWP